MSRPKDVPEEPNVRLNPALDQVERWTKACQVWNDCETCPHQYVCRMVGDLLVNYLSNPHMAAKIRLVCSSSIT
jgi:hypothetical protein